MRFASGQNAWALRWSIGSRALISNVNAVRIPPTCDTNNNLFWARRSFSLHWEKPAVDQITRKMVYDEDILKNEKRIEINDSNLVKYI